MLSLINKKYKSNIELDDSLVIFNNVIYFLSCNNSVWLDQYKIKWNSIFNRIFFKYLGKFKVSQLTVIIFIKQNIVYFYVPMFYEYFFMNIPECLSWLGKPQVSMRLSQGTILFQIILCHLSVQIPWKYKSYLQIEWCNKLWWHFHVW